MDDDPSIYTILVLGILFASLLGTYTAYSVYKDKDELKYNHCLQRFSEQLCERYEPVDK